MKDDVTMARMDDLVAFAQLHNLKIGTIRDLIAYRRRYDHLVECVAELPFKSEFGGDWVAKSFTNKASGGENLALVKGRIDPGKPTLVRMHVMSPLSDMFGAVTPRARLLEQSMRLIAEEGTGVVVVINRAGPVGLCRRRHWPKRSLSAIIANAARAASPPLSFSDLRARTHAWASFSTVKIPLPTASPSIVSAISPRALSFDTISK